MTVQRMKTTSTASIKATLTGTAQGVGLGGLRILFLDRLFTWNRVNSVTDCCSVYKARCKF